MGSPRDAGRGNELGPYVGDGSDGELMGAIAGLLLSIFGVTVGLAVYGIERGYVSQDAAPKIIFGLVGFGLVLSVLGVVLAVVRRDK